MNIVEKALIRITMDELGIFNETHHKIAKKYLNSSSETEKEIVYQLAKEILNPIKILSTNMIIKNAVIKGEIL